MSWPPLLGLQLKPSSITTGAMLLARTLMRCVAKYPTYGLFDHVSQIFMCGGGAYNPNITDFIHLKYPKSASPQIAITKTLKQCLLQLRS